MVEHMEITEFELFELKILDIYMFKAILLHKHKPMFQHIS
jgi:hypothetical protein